MKKAQPEQTELKRQKGFKVKPVWILVALAFFVFAQAYHMFMNWHETHAINVIPFTMEWRGFVEDRYISPVPNDHNPKTVINNTEPGIKVITPKPTATPTPKLKKRVQIDFVPNVEAAETDQVSAQVTDQEIIAYIQSKDWDDEVAVALAKSENFWNLTKSFDCQRTGAQNKNGTRDHGLWQINDIHIKSGAITLEDANDCFKATDFAYGLYKGRNNTFGAWSAYLNKSYLNHL